MKTKSLTTTKAYKSRPRMLMFYRQNSENFEVYFFKSSKEIPLKIQLVRQR